MPTVVQLCSTVLGHLKVRDPSETPRAEDISTLVELMKSLLDSWQVSPSMIVGTDEVTRTPIAGVQSFTIGPTGDIVRRQPLRIEKAWFRVNSIDIPVDVVPLDTYNDMPDKTTRGQPQMVAFDRSYSNGTLYVYPASDGLCELHLVVQPDTVASYDAIVSTDTLTLPTGMQNALEWNLAKEALAAYQVDPMTAQVIRTMASNSRRVFSRSNMKRQILSTGPNRLYDINVG